MKKLDVVIGLDQSLSHSGYSLFSSGKLYNFGSILTDERRGSERLFYIKEECPCLAVIEGYSFGSKGKAKSSLQELGGVVKLLFYQRNIPLYVVAPAALKKYICGPGCGFAMKEMVQCTIFDLYDLQFEDDNIADAFVLGLIAHELNIKIRSGCFSVGLENHQVEVLNTILGSDLNEV